MASLHLALDRLAICPDWVVVSLDYELGYLLEPKTAPPGWLTSPTRPLARFWCFSDCQIFDREAADSWLNQRLSGVAAGVGGVSPLISEDAYSATVHRIKSLIFEGDCYQVNLTFPLEFEWFGSPLDLYARLRAQQPVRYGGFVGSSTEGLVSLSPELFLARQGKRLQTRPMKGTAPRHTPPEQLRASVKDQAENLMIVDLLRNDLGRVAVNGSVVVDRLFEIEDYPTVWQMVSEVSAEVRNVSFLDILTALFPCGSITGAPKVRAMQIAAELEPEPRGLYTGALGWLAPNGDFRLNVAIRTLQLALGGGGKMGLGSGIVADSTASAEWQECLLKAKFLQACDPGLQLIETLRLEDGRYPYLERHLARLRQSAEWFDFPLDETGLRRGLEQQPAAGLWRVRLTLAKSGQTQMGVFALHDEPDVPRYARLAGVKIDAANPLRRHKTTERQIYDQALAQLGSDPAIFDLVFLNQRGELAEGARSNIFVERGGVLLTPPLSSGCLPGVLRSELLAKGQAQEAVLWPDDLAAGFWMGNALRGLIRVELQR
jgi:para-aminobenzoate synthetase/4-amino-4-deoxychorismate lyase